MSKPIQKNERTKRGKIFGLIIIMSTILFEVFSFASSVRALNGWFGPYPPFNRWAAELALAFCLADIAIAPVIGRNGGLIRLIIHFFRFKTWQAAGMIALILTWIITAFGDTFLTFVAIVQDRAARPVPSLVSAGLISQDTWMISIPVFIACLVWLLQYLLIEQTDKAAVTLAE